MVRHVEPREDQMALPNEDLAREATRPWGEETSTLCRTSISRRTSAGTVPGRGPLAGNYERVAQVIDLFGRIFELSGGTARIELHDVLANDDHTVTLAAIHAERAGKQYRDNLV